MKSRSWWSVFGFAMALLLTVALLFAAVPAAFGWVDEFGGDAFSAPYAPYTNIAPHVPENLMVRQGQYLPYTPTFWGQYLEW